MNTERQYVPYGGQAVVEGVMMRGPRFFAVACRKPDGTIDVHLEDVEAGWLGRLSWLKRPFLRGGFALIDAMTLGIRALKYSADLQIEQEGQSERTKRLNDVAVGGTLVLGLALGIGLFVILPTLITGLLPWRHATGLNVLDGLVRITFFVAYIAVVGRMEAIARVFAYHGAEHKCINAMELGQPLTVESAMSQSRIHPRCGTSFVVVVLLLSILVFSLFGRPPAYIRVPMHLVLLPVVAGIAYEVIRLAGRMRNTRWLRFALAPGMATQALSTREPDAEQVEVALAALTAVVAAEERGCLPEPTDHLERSASAEAQGEPVEVLQEPTGG